MAYIRQLPSGLWAGTVRTPAGRITETRELKGAVQAWAENLEADINRGDFLDPRLAKRTVGEVWTRYAPARRVEMVSRKRDESHWKVWVAPRWAAEPIGGIVKPDVQTWVNELEEQGVGLAFPAESPCTSRPGRVLSALLSTGTWLSRGAGVFLSGVPIRRSRGRPSASFNQRAHRPNGHIYGTRG